MTVVIILLGDRLRKDNSANSLSSVWIASHLLRSSGGRGGEGERGREKREEREKREREEIEREKENTNFLRHIYDIDKFC